MKSKKHLGEVNNCEFFDDVAKQTLRTAHRLNQQDKDPKSTFRDISRGIILGHAKKDRDFFVKRFHSPDDVEVCSQIVSLCVEEMVLKYLFKGQTSQLEHFEEYEKTAVAILRAISQGIPVDIKTFLTQCHRLAFTDIRTVQLRNPKKRKPLSEKMVRAQERKIGLFLQRSDDYFLFNTFLSPNLRLFAERLMLRKRLENVLRFQLGQRTWKNVDHILNEKESVRIRNSMPQQHLLLQ